MMKTGLVLEGGAHRAIYVAGVLDVFMEKGITFDGVVGVSAGAIHGGSYVAKQKGRNIGYTLKYASDKRYMSFYSLITTGDLVGKKFCYCDLPDKLVPFDYEAFKKAKTKFYAVCSNLESGEGEIIEIKDMKKQMDVLRASASMPLVSQIVEFDGKKYLDGGIADSIPLRKFQKLGYKKCVVVETRPDGYEKKPNPLAWLAKIVYRKYPNFLKALVLRHNNYNAELYDIETASKNGEVFLIKPSKFLKIGRMEKDPEKLKSMYELGRADALKNLSDLKKFLSIK